MTWLRRLRRVLPWFSCRHAHRMFQRDDDGRLMLSCADCFDTVPALKVESDYQFSHTGNLMNADLKRRASRKVDADYPAEAQP